MRFVRIGVSNRRVVSMNVAQKRDPRAWKKLRELGLVGELKAPLVASAPIGSSYPPQSDPSVEPVPMPALDAMVGESGPLAAFGSLPKVLSPSERYGHQTIIVWNEHQRVPASSYAKAQLAHCRVTIEVTDKAGERLAQLGGDRAMIYHHS